MRTELIASDSSALLDLSMQLTYSVSSRYSSCSTGVYSPRIDPGVIDAIFQCLRASPGDLSVAFFVPHCLVSGAVLLEGDFIRAPSMRKDGILEAHVLVRGLFQLKGVGVDQAHGGSVGADVIDRGPPLSRANTRGSCGMK